ncbi:MAG TPA: hypothetical protein VL485_07895 [Ktedonobacteraceae bacterium]|nr:hypothetical protein [Ktedonobacteraceae bacterium]
MGQKVLIATTQDILCAGLKTIFRADPRVSEVAEVRCQEDLYVQLALDGDLDFLVVSQTMISDMALLPERRFAVLAVKPDLALMRLAYEHGARGYFSKEISAEMLRILLDPRQDGFLVDPFLGEWIVRCLFEKTVLKIT